MSDLLCVDASVAAKWVLPEEDSDLALRLYESCRSGGTMLIAPPHLPIEVGNAIWRKVPRDLLSAREATELLDAFLSFAVGLAVPQGLYERALELARDFHRPTVYDTHYLALAEIAGCDLVTADQRLLNALDGKLDYVKPLGAFATRV